MRARPLVHVEDGRILVHAGLHPRWTAARARALAAEIEAGLVGDDWRALLAALRGPTPPWRDDLADGERMRTVLAWLVRARTCTPDGALDDEFVGPPREARTGYLAWFAVPDAAWTDHEVVFGHWASLGLDLGPHHVATDSGCVWGNRLTAVRLDDRAVFQVSAAERHS